MKRTLIIAHRGSSGDAPENTLPAFKLAAEQGADMVELDLHFSRDGQPVVIHDETLDRTTNGTGAVGGFDLQHIQSLDAGSWFSPRFSGTPVPSLEEVLKALKSRPTGLLAEVKQAPVDESSLRMLCGLLAREAGRRPVFVQSFSVPLLDTLKQICPPLQSFLVLRKLSDEALRAAVTLGCKGISLRWSGLNSHTLRVLRRRNFPIFVWTVDNRGPIKKVLGFGVDGIITNFPARALKLAETD